MGRKSTDCPESIKRPIEIARLFPSGATDATVEAFEAAYIATVFAPKGIYERYQQAMKDAAPLELNAIEELDLQFERELANQIRANFIIDREMLKLAVRMRIQPGKEAFRKTLWELWATCSELRGLALTTPWRIGKGLPVDDLFPQKVLATGHTIYLKRSSLFRIEENGTLSEVDSRRDVISTIVKEKIDISRIRICRECRHVFWARRSTKESCSPECSQKQARRKKEESK